ncbi:Sec-independent protein translocase protein TatB [Psychrobacter sp. AOP22-C1-22]|uniref:Sec-independent protein translocase protein TatB n=1 Tax=unclassified Psychrobacter TaxID=196806 RepID=UPI0017880060|nr:MULTISPECIES: Sec-independent protein translocase protein TatB [unclassified Psychrobacter]MBE0406945.1 twin-arginine translocase subunit TatB [Psychrobacter sp. FME6]MBE0445139.1 twin-arginine translocase subunit TatB [Psychrobacter sp. FME5]MDN5801323.1 Sec-independent protein translocase protein TatB [Psychrobacter sp.]MDN5890540.1 Sec-independent protein translocase protein TatB [Psychrobacter sp.]
MFDIGFSELLLFGVIALIVLGPEKLPQAARTAGQWYAKIRRTVSTLQSEIEAELDLAETRQQMQKELAKIRQTEADMRREMAEMRGNIKEFEYSQNQHLKATHNAVVDDKQDKSVDIESQQSSIQPATPKEFDYRYEKNEQNDKSEVSGDSLKADANDTNDTIDQVTQTISTKPWENMWFRLGAYDKARRLPAPPYLPNYKADILLNNHLDSHLNTQAAAHEQETD